jgi:hypothetical protein
MLRYVEFIFRVSSQTQKTQVRKKDNAFCIENCKYVASF